MVNLHVGQQIYFYSIFYTLLLHHLDWLVHQWRQEKKFWPFTTPPHYRSSAVFNLNVESLHESLFFFSMAPEVWLWRRGSCVKTSGLHLIKSLLKKPLSAVVFPGFSHLTWLRPVCWVQHHLTTPFIYIWSLMVLFNCVVEWIFWGLMFQDYG